MHAAPPDAPVAAVSGPVHRPRGAGTAAGAAGHTAAPVTAPASPPAAEPVLAAEHVTAWYGDVAGIRDVSLRFAEHTATALIGPSGCG